MRSNSIDSILKRHGSNQRCSIVHISIVSFPDLPQPCKLNSALVNYQVAEYIMISLII